MFFPRDPLELPGNLVVLGAEIAAVAEVDDLMFAANAKDAVRAAAPGAALMLLEVAAGGFLKPFAGGSLWIHDGILLGGRRNTEAKKPSIFFGPG